MVDVATWEGLSDDERREFRTLLPFWQRVLADRGVCDGAQLCEGWEIIRQEGIWAFAVGGTVLPQPRSSSRAVLNALRTDAIQNLNR